MAEVVDQIAIALSGHGLIPRGGLTFEAGEPTPPGPSGAPAKSILLVGQRGSAPWPYFQRWREARHFDIADPLDTWSREIIGGVALRFGARAISPSDTPFLPFQQWAMRAEGLRPSPLGILMHPEFGLWHAYRGALLFDEELSIEAPEKMNHLCDACDGKPCLNACPVDAFSEAGFAYRDCVSHVRGPTGGGCRDTGCIARNACPYGTAYRYPADVQAFHMASFAG